MGEARRPSPLSPRGSATHICKPWIGPPVARFSAPVRSECTMPRPAVIQFTSPGLIATAVPSAVAVHDLAVEQIGDGGEPDMRMRPHVEPVAGAEFRRPEMVEEDERPDHARARRGQRAPHRKAVAEIDRARHHDVGDRLAGVSCRRPAGPCRGRNSCSSPHLLLLCGRPMRYASVTNFCPFTASRKPSKASLILPQFGSFFMAASQRCTFG